MKPLVAFALLLSSVALAEPHPATTAADVPLLTVTGTADISVAPDRATLRLGCVAQADTAANAQSQVSDAVEKILDALKDLRIPPADITTAGLSLTPVYSQPPRDNANPDGFQPKIVAYRADNTIQVRLNDLKNVGPAVDASIAAGANQVESLVFDLKDDTAAQSRALADAVKQARAKADTLATAAGVTLVSLHDLEESATGPTPVPYPGVAMRAMAAQASATPIQPGQVTLSASVTLRYAIAPAK